MTGESRLKRVNKNLILFTVCAGLMCFFVALCVCKKIVSPGANRLEAQCKEYGQLPKQYKC